MLSRPDETHRVSGEVGAVRSLYDEHAACLLSYLARRVGSDLAEDLLAETFRAAIESYSKFDPARGTANGWLFGIATNLLRRHWRTERRQLLALERSASRTAPTLDPLLALADDVATRIDAEADARRLLRAVVELRSEDRDLLILSGWEHLNSTEIGQVLGIAPATVRSRLRRMRADLGSAMSTSSNPNTPNTGAHS
jgi:RNA polymerase sigma-70 factor (ECF subfamily)